MMEEFPTGSNMLPDKFQALLKWLQDESDKGNKKRALQKDIDELIKGEDADR